MSWNITFFLINILLGIGLAIDGFLISLSNGLNYSQTNKKRIVLSAITFALFQFVAVMIGWFCVVKLTKYFSFVEYILSYIAIIILCIIGTKMIVEGAKKCHKERKTRSNMQNLRIEKDVNDKIKTNNNDINILDDNLSELKFDNKKEKSRKAKRRKSWVITLIVQGLVTSVDALSVGFVISDTPFISAIVSALIISLITLSMYIIGFNIGKRFGVKLGSKAEIIGGIVFILIGIEILVTSSLK